MVFIIPLFNFDYKKHNSILPTTTKISNSALELGLQLELFCFDGDSPPSY